jgi:extradiol dioxygenase family protein
MNLPPFHLAIPVTDLAAARGFYGDLLGCTEGRSAKTWVDFNFHGHQLVCHLVPAARDTTGPTNPVDGKQVPIPHFGLVLEMAAWKRLAAHLQARGVEFVIEPYIRFAGQTGEQATLFLRDPCGNAIEFKAFRDIERQLFAT